MPLSRGRLKELLSYDAEAGRFIWRVSRGTRCAGSMAGNRRPDGYIYIKIDRVLYRASRLVWLYLFGKWPQEHIDHINGNTSDDRLVNLREATRSQNLGNRKLNKNSSTGFKGVSKSGKRYKAYVNKDGKRHWLGLFDSAAAAAEAYGIAARSLHGEFARTN